MVVINHVYELQFGRGRQYLGKGLVSDIVGNWDINGIWTMYTGMHFSLASGTSVSNVLTGSAVNVSPIERPNLDGTPNLPSDLVQHRRILDSSAIHLGHGGRRHPGRAGLLQLRLGDLPQFLGQGKGQAHIPGGDVQYIQPHQLQQPGRHHRHFERVRDQRHLPITHHAVGFEAGLLR